MARYIDADKIMEEINRIGGHNLCEWETLGVKALIDRQPTADVVPKSEVAREIFEEFEKQVASKLYMKIKPIFKDYMDFEDGFRNGKNDALLEVLMLIAELKKKYTEEKK